LSLVPDQGSPSDGVGDLTRTAFFQLSSSINPSRVRRILSQDHAVGSMPPAIHTKEEPIR
jgi:hypothetical protein